MFQTNPSTAPPTQHSGFPLCHFFLLLVCNSNSTDLTLRPVSREFSLSAMDSSYSSLLERTRAPHLSLQKFAVISIFQKLRSSPPLIDSGSDPGRDAITQCLRSASPAVVDQSVRELCRLVTDSKLDLSHALLELQSALEGCDSRFVDVFVKGKCDERRVILVIQV